MGAFLPASFFVFVTWIISLSQATKGLDCRYPGPDTMSDADDLECGSAFESPDGGLDEAETTGPVMLQKVSRPSRVEVSAEKVVRLEARVAGRSDDLFQGCRAKANSGWTRSAQFSSTKTAAGGSVATNATDVAGLPTSKAVGKCSGTQIPLFSYQLDAISTTCCSGWSVGCAGCERISQDGWRCAACAGGFLKRGKTCVACADSAGWVTADGRTCPSLAEGECSNVKVRGLSSNEACCKCGGGHVSATPFVYEDKTWAIGAAINMAPTPRTAKRYSINEGCQLPEYNLTLNGKTGKITYVNGSSMPTVPFTVQCEVVAHQGATTTFTTKVVVAVGYFTYNVPMLLVPDSAQQEFSPIKASGQWKDFGVHCAPEVGWLKIDTLTGVLSRHTQSSAVGAVTEVTRAAGLLEGQTGGICVVTAWHQEKYDVAWKLRKAKVIAVWPKPWQSLRYSSMSVSVSVGEQVPLMHPTKPAEAGFLRPSSFAVACTVLGGHKQFVFDEILGVGLLDGHSILEVDEQGAISVSPSPTLTQVFDSMDDVAAGIQKSLKLDCTVWGSFPDLSLPAIKAKVAVEILDSTCWVAQTFRSKATVVPGAATETTCRSTCRLQKDCSHWSWKSGKCFQHRRDVGPGGSSVTAFAKVTNCTAQHLCLRLATSTWYQSGDYCPVGPDLVRGGVVYRKDGLTPSETIYLSKHSESVDGAVSGCSDGNWALRTAEPSRDYMMVEKGYFEFGGQLLICLPADSNKVSMATLGCNAPTILLSTNPSGKEEEAESELSPYVFDDPSTADPADHWLHPCDCAPSAWGLEPPVNPEAFEDIPPRSENMFTPPPVEIVSGQFACPAKSLFSVHFASDVEAMERDDCEARCKAQVDCHFFWTGVQQSANTCRLYSACDHLVRELGLEGRLFALPREKSCLVADADTCWAVSLRRNSLGTVQSPEMTFRYLNLYVQCDEALLLGGLGVEECGKPQYRKVDSHAWQHKRPLPDSFTHGTQLVVSCWTERYFGLQNKRSKKSDALQCVNGGWFDSKGKPDVTGFKCGACVQVAAPGYQKIQERNEQELYFFDRMQLSIFTEVSSGVGPDEKVGCLEQGRGLEDVALVERATCASALLAETMGGTSPDSRHMRMIKDQNNRCLQEVMQGDIPAAVHRECSDDEVAQQMPISNLPLLLWHLHIASHEQQGTWFAPGNVDCTGQGGVGQLDFGHLFNPSKSGIAAVLGRMQLPVSFNGKASGDWQQISWGAVSVGLHSWPKTTKVRACVTYTDWFTDAHTGNTKLHIRLRRTGQGGERFLVEDYGNTNSKSKIIYSACGRWIPSSQISCGGSFSNACQIDMLHGAGAQVQIYSYDLELGTDDLSLATSYKGRFQSVGKHYDGIPGSWTDITEGDAFGLSTDHYQEADKFRACISFTDHGDSASEGVRVRVRKHQTKAVVFEDAFGFTWSNSGLYHQKCGEWRSMEALECGFGWNTACNVEVRHAQKVQTKIHSYNLEFQKSGEESSSVFLGRANFPHRASVQGLRQWKPVGTDKFIRFDTSTYSSATDLRLCVSYTDNYQGAANLKFRLRRRDSGGGAVFLEDAFPGTYSAGKLVHYRCGSWNEYKWIDCGGTWATTCQLDVVHSGGEDPGVRVDVFDFDLEFRAAIKSGVCRFAPVLGAGKTVQTYAVKKNSGAGGQWLNWQEKLADTPVECPAGAAAVKLEMKGEDLNLHCGIVAGLGSCMEWYTPQASVSSWAKPDALVKLSVVCGENSLLKGFHFEFSEGGKWARFRYNCCKAAGAPMVVVPRGPREDGASNDGLYCPLAVDESGRSQYWRYSPTTEFLGPGFAKPNSSGMRRVLVFSPNTGVWCIDKSCTDVEPRVEPVGLIAPGFEVVAVTDFRGQFKGKGVPEMGANKRVTPKMHRWPRVLPRPKAPKKPKMATFTPQDAKYEAECIDYTELWDSISESYKDASGELVTEVPKLQAEEPEERHPEKHPCAVAAEASGIRGRLVGGDGKETPEKLSYEELEQCQVRDIERAVLGARKELSSSVWEELSNVADASLDLMCDIPPNIEVAPIGLGAEIQIEDLCTDFTDFGKTMMKVANKGVGLGKVIMDYMIEEEGYQDCNPIQLDMDRIFCDLYCVRDAVIRGDRNINRNLKAATDITNKNMDALAKWTVSSNSLETGWIGDKMDVLGKNLKTDLDAIFAKIPDPQLLQSEVQHEAQHEAQQVAKQMLLELNGFAESASFSSLSRRTAQDSLDKFARTAEVLTQDANASQVRAALIQLSSLHSALRSAGSASKLQVLSAQLGREAHRLHEAARLQMEILGVYRQHSNVTRRVLHAWRGEQGTRQQLLQAERHAALLNLDRLWWSIRGKLDDYIDASEVEVRANQHTFAMLSSYEHCSTGIQALIASHGASLAARDFANRRLQNTWHGSVNLLGELAATVSDGGFFDTFFEEEGCNSTLARQTMKQARFAVGGMKLLLHRFKFSELPNPDLEPLRKAVQQIEQSHDSSLEGCVRSHNGAEGK